MEQEIENQGYVVEGKMTELTKAFLVLWTVRSGLMSYENMVQVAKDNNLTKDQIPHLRTANNAFAKAKDSLKGMPMDTLLELEGWDGQVKQHLDVKNLLRGNEYQVSIVREGIMNGKLHKESIPVVRLKFSPPSDFNANAWVKNYVRSFWDEKYIAKIESGEEEAPQISAISQCISQEPYWEDTRVDPMLTMNIRNRVMQAFQTYVTGVDQEMLKAQFLRVLTQDLNGIEFQAGRAAIYVPAEVDGKKTSETLDSLSNLIASFAAGTSVEATRNYYDENGEPIKRGLQRRTALRYLGYLSGSRELEYIRQDLGEQLSREVTEYHAQLTKLVDAFDEDKVEEFEKKVEIVAVKRKDLDARLASMADIVDGDVPVSTTMYPDMDHRFSSRLAAIPQERSEIASKIERLARFN
tara:strand:- start:784 stop:2013 length:1230 start_codon:yes stop_codon:yes gene_type:complete